jgi:hypothetical protein
MHAADADLALARARCLYALGRFASGRVVVDRLEASGYDFRTVEEALVRLKLLEHTETDRAKVVEAYAQQRRRFGSFEFDWYYADFLVRAGMKAEALDVIQRVEETKRQLDAMGQPYDRPWMRRVLRLRATIGE